jgi:hypothetical protein
MAHTPASTSAWTVLSTLAAMGSLVVSVIALQKADQSTQIAADAHALSQRADDRSAGKVGTNIAMEAEPAAVSLEKQDDLDAATLDVRVKNLGEEPFDMLRVGVMTSAVWTNRRGSPLNFGLGDGGDTRNVKQQDEFEFFDRKLPAMVPPGGALRIDLKKEILQRLVRIDYPPAKDRELFVIFQITVTGRLVGHDTPSGKTVAGSRSVFGTRPVWTKMPSISF